MKVGVISDTHDNISKIEKAVQIFNSSGVELVLHAGDFVSPFTALVFNKLKAKMVGVFGNNDGDKLLLLKRFSGIAELYQDYYETEIERKKIVLMHEPKFIDVLASSAHYSAIIYGHTHKQDIREGKTVVINPGECGGWLTGKSHIAILDLKNMKVEVIEL